LLHDSGFGRENFEGKPKFELYDMTADPLEQNDLAGQRPDIIRAMRKQYEEWFADVSGTRADNYTPPRIYIGTIYENPVVLTRQDWRHVKGRTWAANSNGYWELYAAKANNYDIKIDFPAANTKGEVLLEVSGTKNNRTINKGESSVKFADITIDKGPTRLMATLTFAYTTRGPWHVNISW
jgi:hypothetical protein